MGDHEPHHRNFRPQQIEESDNDIIGEDLTTLPKPEIDLANNKPRVDVQALGYILPNRSEITTIIPEEASKAPPPTFHAVRSVQLAERVLHERRQRETRQANTNAFSYPELRSSWPAPRIESSGRDQLKGLF